jgi:hypothetical protein
MEGGKQVDVFFLPRPLDFFGVVSWSFVPVEHLLPGYQVRPFQTESFQEFRQGCDDINPVTVAPPGNMVHIDNTSVIEESRDYLPSAARRDLGLLGTWCTLLCFVMTAFFVSVMCIDMADSSIMNLSQDLPLS